MSSDEIRDQGPPAGFRLLAPFDPLTAALAPLYASEHPDGSMVVGFRIGPQHCNPRGTCHGGTWATLADVLMGVNAGLLTGVTGPTISMHIDYMSAGVPGQWIEGHARVLSHSPGLCFVECTFCADGRILLLASAIFRRKRVYDRMVSGLFADPAFVGGADGTA